jgi:hypothetical protein
LIEGDPEAEAEELVEELMMQSAAAQQCPACAAAAGSRFYSLDHMMNGSKSLLVYDESHEDDDDHDEGMMLCMDEYQQAAAAAAAAACSTAAAASLMQGLGCANPAAANYYPASRQIAATFDDHVHISSDDRGSAAIVTSTMPSSVLDQQMLTIHQAAGADHDSGPMNPPYGYIGNPMIGRSDRNYQLAQNVDPAAQAMIPFDNYSRSIAGQSVADHPIGGSAVSNTVVDAGRIDASSCYRIACGLLPQHQQQLDRANSIPSIVGNNVMHADGSNIQMLMHGVGAGGAAACCRDHHRCPNSCSADSGGRAPCNALKISGDHAEPIMPTTIPTNSEGSRAQRIDVDGDDLLRGDGDGDDGGHSSEINMEEDVEFVGES